MSENARNDRISMWQADQNGGVEFLTWEMLRDMLKRYMRFLCV